MDDATLCGRRHTPESTRRRSRHSCGILPSRSLWTPTATSSPVRPRLRSTSCMPSWLDRRFRSLRPVPKRHQRSPRNLRSAWRSPQGTKPCQSVRAVATPRAPLERKRNRPSCGLGRCGAAWCDTGHKQRRRDSNNPANPAVWRWFRRPLVATSAFSAAARVYRVVRLFFRAFPGRLRQSFQDQVGRLDDPLITWTQIRFESFTRQVLQTNDIANANFITLLGGKLHVGILDHATGKFF